MKNFIIFITIITIFTAGKNAEAADRNRIKSEVLKQKQIERIEKEEAIKEYDQKYIIK